MDTGEKHKGFMCREVLENMGPASGQEEPEAGKDNVPNNNF